jgi:polar amino acid transport system substrate-binding protein
VSRHGLLYRARDRPRGLVEKGGSGRDVGGRGSLGLGVIKDATSSNPEEGGVRSSRSTAVALIGVIAIVASGCSASSGSTGQPAAGGPSAGVASGVAGDPSHDKLAQILDRGTLVGYHEPDYAPMSFDVEGSTRATGTKCGPNQLTASQVDGFDNETTKLVAKGLGVEACFVTPTWTEITGGNWGDRLDIAYGSGSINADRMKRLWMTQPYYGVDNFFYVRDDSPVVKAAELSGKQIGACASCSHEYYLKGTLEIPGVKIVNEVNDPVIVTYETEQPGLKDVADGKIDAFLVAEPTGEQAIKDGLPLRKLEKSAFTYYPSGFVDKSSGLDPKAFVEKVNQIIRGLQADGTLKAASEKYIGKDYATAGGAFDLDAIGQNIP